MVEQQRKHFVCAVDFSRVSDGCRKKIVHAFLNRYGFFGRIRCKGAVPHKEQIVCFCDALCISYIAFRQLHGSYPRKVFLQHCVSGIFERFSDRLYNVFGNPVIRDVEPAVVLIACYAENACSSGKERKYDDDKRPPISGQSLRFCLLPFCLRPIFAVSRFFRYISTHKSTIPSCQIHSKRM